MTKKITRICDACGVEYSNFSNALEITVHNLMSSDDELEYYDLCPRCTEKWYYSDKFKDLIK